MQMCAPSSLSVVNSPCIGGPQSNNANEISMLTVPQWSNIETKGFFTHRHKPTGKSGHHQKQQSQEKNKTLTMPLGDDPTFNLSNSVVFGHGYGNKGQNTQANTFSRISSQASSNEGADKDNKAQIRMSLPNQYLKQACEMELSRIRTEEPRYMVKNRNASHISSNFGGQPSHRKGNVTEIVTSNNQIRVACGVVDDSIVFDVQGSKLRMNIRPERKQQYQPPPLQSLEEHGSDEQKIFIKPIESTMKYQNKFDTRLLSPMNEFLRNSQSFNYQLQTPQKPQTSRNFSHLLQSNKESFIDRQVKQKSFLPSPQKYSHQEQWCGEKYFSPRFKHNQTADKEKQQPKQKIKYENGPAGKYAVVETWRSVLQVKERDFSVNDDLNDFMPKPPIEKKQNNTRMPSISSRLNKLKALSPQFTQIETSDLISHFDDTKIIDEEQPNITHQTNHTIDSRTSSIKNSKATYQTTNQMSSSRHQQKTLTHNQIMHKRGNQLLRILRKKHNHNFPNSEGVSEDELQELQENVDFQTPSKIHLSLQNLKHQRRAKRFGLSNQQ